MDVEAVYVGAAPGYRLEKTAQTSKRAGVGESAGGGEAAEKTSTGAEAVDAVRRGEEGGGVERLLEDVRREFSGLPVYVGVKGGYVYVKRTAPMDQRQFRRCLETCRWL